MITQIQRLKVLVRNDTLMMQRPSETQIILTACLDRDSSVLYTGTIVGISNIIRLMCCVMLIALLACQICKRILQSGQ